MSFVRRAALMGLAIATIQSAAFAAPTNTTLPGGWSWNPVGTGSYDTGLVGTARGGFNGQTSGPYNDTSFGVMDETGTPWHTGADLSAQQYVQRQIFGNFGTNAPPGPSGARFYNPGYQGTGAGTNFPQSGSEQRSVSLNHWSNPNPDAGGIATYGQVVYVPVLATLSSGIGWGADEMLLKVIGGTSGQTSQFFVDATLNASFNTSAFGGILAAGNSIRVNAVTQVNDAGPGDYDVSWGFGSVGGINQFRVAALDAVYVNGAYVGDPAQGIPINSVGYGFTNNYNVLASLVQSGGSFNIDFLSDATLVNLVRDFGNADCRASMGPGFEGNARLYVEWQAFQAIPAPGSIVLLSLGGFLAARRRRST